MKEGSKENTSTLKAPQQFTQLNSLLIFIHVSAADQKHFLCIPLALILAKDDISY